MFFGENDDPELSQFKYLKIETDPSDQVVHLLEENVIGTPGKSMLYRHHNVAKKLADIPGAHYANLSIRDRLYGTICLSKREVHGMEKLRSAYYLRYFTFREQMRSADQGERTDRSKSNIRQEVKRLMNGEGLKTDDDLLLYAYIDAQNIRSKRLIEEYGFSKIGTFNVVPFSRIFPKKSDRVEIADITKEPLIMSTLSVVYREFQLVSFENLFKRGDFFYIEDKGKLVCGIQGVVDQWDIVKMPGISGNLLMHVLPKIPLLGKLFNPKFKFVMLELAFFRNGYENLLSELFESVLNYYKLNSGILCIDPRSELYGLLQYIDLGLTHKIQGEKQIEIVAKASKKDLIDHNRPFAISGFDVL